MSVINKGWYNQNENRSYPVDESATGKGTGDLRIPNSILSAVKISYPVSRGKFAYISSIGVTKHRASITFSASDNWDGSDSSPLGVVAITASEFVDHQSFEIEGQSTGVAGWVVFGSEVFGGLEYTSRFSGPSQSHLVPRAYRAYKDFPVSSVSRSGLDLMSGLVNLVGTSPVEVVSGKRLLDGEETDVIVIQLEQGRTSSDQGATSRPAPMQSFIGKCEKRVESLNCGGIDPIYSVNSVSSNCNGNINIEFRGCASIGSITGGGSGIVLDCGLDVSDLCLPKNLPDEDGGFPDESVDQCAPIDNSPGGGTGVLPYESNAGEPPITLKRGYFEFNESGGSPTLKTITTGLDYPNRSIAWWNGWDDATSDRIVTMDFELHTIISGMPSGIGILLNYLEGTTPSVFRYHMLDLDLQSQRLRILKGGGSPLKEVYPGEEFSGFEVVENIEYQMIASIALYHENQVKLTATIQEKDTPANSATMAPVVIPDYFPDTGKFGIHAFHCLGTVNKLRIEGI